MPIYEFVCKECHHEFRTLTRSNGFNGDALAKCPTCGTGKVARLLSVTARTSGADGMARFEEAGGCDRPGGCCMNPGGCRLN